MKKLLAILATALLLLTAVLFTNFKLAEASAPIPQTQFFHIDMPVQNQILCPGTVTVATFSFTTMHKGAFDLTTSQDIELTGSENSGEGTIINAVLDGVKLPDSIERQSPDNNTGGRGWADFMTTHSVSASTHTLSITYTTNYSGCSNGANTVVNLTDGTASLAVVSPATSN